MWYCYFALLGALAYSSEEIDIQPPLFPSALTDFYDLYELVHQATSPDDEASPPEILVPLNDAPEKKESPFATHELQDDLGSMYLEAPRNLVEKAPQEVTPSTADGIDLRRPPIISLFTDAVRGLLTLQSALVGSAIRHNPFLTIEGIEEEHKPHLRSEQHPNSLVASAMEGMSAMAMSSADSLRGVNTIDNDDNPFAQLTQNAVEVLVDSLQTNAKFWAVPVQQAGLLIHELFAGLADITQLPKITGVA